jgi:HSP20 family protein
MRPLFPSLFGDRSMPVSALQRRINHLFDEFTERGALSAQQPADWHWNMPAVDVVENADQIEVTAELPDVKQEDIQLQFDGDQLVMKGEKRVEREHKDEEKGPEGYHLQERFYGHFERRIPIHVAVNRELITAEYENGVLKVLMPKSAEQKDQHQKIDIKFAE